MPEITPELSAALRRLKSTITGGTRSMKSGGLLTVDLEDFLDANEITDDDYAVVASELRHAARRNAEWWPRIWGNNCDVVVLWESGDGPNRPSSVNHSEEGLEEFPPWLWDLTRTIVESKGLQDQYVAVWIRTER